MAALDAASHLRNFVAQHLETKGEHSNSDAQMVRGSDAGGSFDCGFSLVSRLN